MNNFAVIETGGKQYRVKAGDVLRVEKLADEVEAGAKITFDKVLLKAEGEKVEVGTPYLKGAVVEGEAKGNVRGERKMVFRYHSKTRYRKKKTHRQRYTEVRITRI
ncbi:50S ribosomal protein L21 [Candidatus Jorgensenbacteria bacterium CG10_big_fil_rev_8_21_14_0_10_54_38]|uniref:Large ribosomal subunit protein bL21 n=2 Tax=Candidatus Joergenseniibacteriota TaxID=1752739 RepID=A0A2M6WFZ3_9BACT|nr:MAG: 50S ribosomal protein L21 [Candidatus Jorgensenbacteria bacterium CG23_combo_of_CG06-09_8_20_14_all_54_14]PIT91654.1 MAG: 50S ribosomal protein L21 [Candidatus Jorgensenbacteria bacterium CG10_big_fil_rev_8_21_14_0_10_54_38]